MLHVTLGISLQLVLPLALSFSHSTSQSREKDERIYRSTSGGGALVVERIKDGLLWKPFDKLVGVVACHAGIDMNEQWQTLNSFTSSL